MCNNVKHQVNVAFISDDEFVASLLQFSKQREAQSSNTKDDTHHTISVSTPTMDGIYTNLAYISQINNHRILLDGFEQYLITKGKGHLVGKRQNPNASTLYSPGTSKDS